MAKIEFQLEASHLFCEEQGLLANEGTQVLRVVVPLFLWHWIPEAKLMGDSIFTDFKARMQIKMAVYIVSAIEVYIQHT